MPISWAVLQEQRTQEAHKQWIDGEIGMDEYDRIANQSYEDYLKELKKKEGRKKRWWKLWPQEKGR